MTSGNRGRGPTSFPLNCPREPSLEIVSMPRRDAEWCPRGRGRPAEGRARRGRRAVVTPAAGIAGAFAAFFFAARAVFLSYVR